jgi:hypothetical protein
VKKNVVFWIGVKNKQYSEKYGGWKWMDISRKSWEYWCKKNDVLFIPFEEPVEQDLTRFRINWQKAIFVFDELENRNIDYDKVWLIDCASVIKWDSPNIFDMVDDRLVGWVNKDNLNWIYDSIKGYQEFFDNFKFDKSKYIASGNIIFNKNHKEFFNSFKSLYYDNIDTFVELQDKIVKKGTEQTPFNYWLQMKDIEINTELPFTWSASHLHRKELFNHNWQLNEDRTPFFIKYCYVWFYTGFSKDQRTDLMNQTWELVKHNYEKNSTIEFLLESIGEDKHTNPTTTSNKFKTDVWNFFKDFKDKICIEFGTHKGQTTKVLSHCFKKVYTINISDESLATARMLNVGIGNIEYVPFDLYSTEILDIDDASVFMIDAGHKYLHVVSDINRCLSMSSGDSCYIIFDDYGLDKHVGDVKKAIDEFIDNNKIELVKKIGLQKGQTLGENVFEDDEGLICRVVK